MNGFMIPGLKLMFALAMFGLATAVLGGGALLLWAFYHVGKALAMYWGVV